MYSYVMSGFGSFAIIISFLASYGILIDIFTLFVPTQKCPRYINK